MWKLASLDQAFNCSWEKTDMLSDTLDDLTLHKPILD